jgi:hypothetical protein
MQDLMCDDATRLFKEYFAGVSIARTATRGRTTGLNAGVRIAMRNLAEHNRVHHCCRTIHLEIA